MDPKYRNEADLKTLGQVLVKQSEDDRFAVVFIFDDSGAAALQERAFDLTEAEGNLYDQHFIGMYNKNANTGFHQLQIMLGGSTTTVSYPK